VPGKHDRKGRLEVQDCAGGGRAACGILGGQYGPQRRHPVPGQVYVGTPDAKVVALDAKTGKVMREKQVADSADGYYGNGAPMIVKGKIVMGTGGPGEMGSRAAVPLREATDGA
jgi:glucose dehydrogenase